MYKNSEGYSSPTEGEAMAHLMYEYRQAVREKYRRQMEIKCRCKVYIVSKYAGDVETNVADAVRYCKFAISRKRIPVASHLLYPQMLDDNNPADRELGTLFGLALLHTCREVWVFGNKFSEGMKNEIFEAKRQNKIIRYYDSNCKEVSYDGGNG